MDIKIREIEEFITTPLCVTLTDVNFEGGLPK